MISTQPQQIIPRAPYQARVPMHWATAMTKSFERRNRLEISVILSLCARAEAAAAAFCASLVATSAARSWCCLLLLLRLALLGLLLYSHSLALMLELLHCKFFLPAPASASPQLSRQAGQAMCCAMMRDPAAAASQPQTHLACKIGVLPEHPYGASVRLKYH